MQFIGLTGFGADEGFPPQTLIDLCLSAQPGTNVSDNTRMSRPIAAVLVTLFAGLRRDCNFSAKENPL